MSMPKRCVVCGGTAPSGHSRCASCERGHQYLRNRAPARAAYRDPVYRAVAVQGERCWVCGQPADDDMTRDHVLPLVFGGSNAQGNIRAAHRAFNSARRVGKA